MMMMMQQQQQLGFEAIASKPSDSEAMITLLIRHLPEAIPHDTLSRLFSHYGASSVRPCSSPRYPFFFLLKNNPIALFLYKSKEFNYFLQIEKLCVSGFQQWSIGLPGSTSVKWVVIYIYIHIYFLILFLVFKVYMSHLHICLHCIYLSRHCFVMVWSGWGFLVKCY